MTTREMIRIREDNPLLVFMYKNTRELREYYNANSKWNMLNFRDHEVVYANGLFGMQLEAILHESDDFVLNKDELLCMPMEQIVNWYAKVASNPINHNADIFLQHSLRSAAHLIIGDVPKPNTQSSLLASYIACNKFGMFESKKLGEVKTVMREYILKRIDVLQNKELHEYSGVLYNTGYGLAEFLENNGRGKSYITYTMHLGRELPKGFFEGETSWSRFMFGFWSEYITPRMFGNYIKGCTDVVEQYKQEWAAIASRLRGEQ